MKTKINNTSPIFIVGCGRSGTTLLRNILGNHSNIFAIPGETFLFALEDGGNVTKLHKILDRTKDKNKLAILTLTLMYYGHETTLNMIDTSEDTPEHITEIFNETFTNQEFHKAQGKCELFNFYAFYLANKENKSRWIEKTPVHTYGISSILNSYPNAKFIEIVRDPRAVYCSWKNTSIDFFRNLNLVEMIIHWETVFFSGRYWKNIIPDQYYRLKYEELTNNPQEELIKLCTFLREDCEPKLLEVSVYNSSIENLNGKEGITNIANEIWKEKLSEDEILFIDSLTKWKRKVLKYPNHEINLSSKTLLSFMKFVVITWRKTDFLGKLYLVKSLWKMLNYLTARNIHKNRVNTIKNKKQYQLTNAK